ncbi:hypothetical protein MUK42_36775 [Musa troglodytarum]|uniref:Uncharacterized protein n=1 Tax=Musa troglodytarum TaxID=320322 RepID=A0A9E7E925_9LILI|nr:hypothetical protein MUK42_36775 [Musa troglodytarum]
MLWDSLQNDLHRKFIWIKNHLEMHSISDSEPNGLPDSDATVPLSPAPSGSDNLQQISDSNEYATDGLKEGTITYEVALERELEYQKRVKTFLTTFCYRYAAPYAISRRCLKQKMMVQPEPTPHENFVATVELSVLYSAHAYEVTVSQHNLLCLFMVIFAVF